MRRILLVILILILVALSLPLVSEGATAHSPTFPGSNNSLANATQVENPSKSWAIYTHLEESTVQYYAIDLKAGDRLYLGLILPADEKGTGFQPEMVILGPFTGTNGTLPSSVELPSGYGWNVINSTFPDRPTYEAFSPSSFLNLATFDDKVSVDGRYYVAVLQTPGMGVVHGNYGLVEGYIESFTISEYTLIPISLLNVYQWEGQSLIQVFIPMVAVIIAGSIGLYIWKRDSFLKMGISHRFAMIAGLLFLGTGANTVVQTIIAVSQTGIVSEIIVTLVFIIAPLLLGWLALRMAFKDSSPLSRRKRIALFSIGLIGLFVWGGLIVGPAIAMAGSILPRERRRLW